MAKHFVRLLETAVGPSRVWIDMGYQLGERWLQPDVSVSWPDQEVKDDWVQGSSMLAIEIASRDTSLRSLGGHDCQLIGVVVPADHLELSAS